MFSQADRATWPLYAASDDGHGKTFRNILLLYWQTLDAASESIERTLFPLFHYVRAPGEQNTHVWPFWGIHRYGGEPGRRTDSFAWPLFEYDRALDGSQSELGLLRLWQLFALLHRERADSDGQTARTRVVTALGDEVHLLSTRSNTTQESDDDGEGTVEFVGFDKSEGLVLPFDQRAGVDEIGGAKIEPADLADDPAEGQVRVSGERREEQVRSESERTQ